MQTENLSSEEIDKLLDKYHNDRQTAEKSLETLELEDIRLKNEKVKLEGRLSQIKIERTALEDPIKKGKNNISRMIQDQKTLERAKWQALKREKGY